MILLFPLIGMDMDGKSVRFGQSRPEVEGLLGEPELVRNSRCYYCGMELALDFDAGGRLEFIEFLGGAEGALHPELYDRDVFASDADELLAFLMERNGEDVDDSEAGYSYALRALSIGLYREITPADVEEMVREMAKMDVTTLGHVDLDAEQRRAARWETIGIGREHYYA